MGLFRKRGETYNAQMLREAGFDVPTLAPQPSVLAAVGVPDGAAVGPKEWDSARTATAPGIAGSRVAFVSLPDGDLIVEDEDGGGDLSPLADAVEEDLQPPYRAVGVRQDGNLWAVAAKRIEVAEFPFAGAESLALSRKDSWEELRADGDSSDEDVPAQLREAGERAGGDFFVKAERIDGDFWEVRVSAL